MNRWITGCLLLTLPCVSACHGGWGIALGNIDRAREDFHYTAQLNPGGRLEVETRNGSVEVVAWDRDRVEVSGTKYADSRERLRQVQVAMDSSPNRLRIHTQGPDTFNGHYGAKYVIHVPTRTVVDTIETSNGAVHLEGLEGKARVRTSNGAIRVSRLEGDLDAHTSNGRIEITGLKGAAMIRTSNGSVQMDEVRGALDVATSNGSVKARVADPEAHKPIRVETSNGSVELAFDQLRENPVRVRTSNSSITMRLPVNANAQLSASTSHGTVKSELEMDATRNDKTHLEAKLGSGGPPVSLSTSNGSIKLLRN